MSSDWRGVGLVSQVEWLCNAAPMAQSFPVVLLLVVVFLIRFFLLVRLCVERQKTHTYKHQEKLDTTVFDTRHDAASIDSTHRRNKIFCNDSWCDKHIGCSLQIH